MICWVPNCSFHEMIISDNTERGSFNTLLIPKKSARNEKFVSKGTQKYKAKLTFQLKFSS